MAGSTVVLLLGCISALERHYSADNRTISA
jgi:hypothetical protein